MIDTRHLSIDQIDGLLGAFDRLSKERALTDEESEDLACLMGRREKRLDQLALSIGRTQAKLENMVAKLDRLTTTHMGSRK